MTTVPSLSARLVDIVRLREQVNGLAQALLPSRSPVFGTVSLATPDVEGAGELAFIRTGSWLYVHYFEVGRVGVRFLIRRNTTTMNAAGQGHDHLELVHALRTWSQHSIDPHSGQHDARIAEICETWFERNSATRLPRTEAHWQVLLEALLTEALDFFALLLELLAKIENDSDRDIICQQWEDRLNRDWPAHRYHNLIAIAATDLGRASLDPLVFYTRYGQSIRDTVALLADQSDLESEARKQIELLLIRETLATLPITGRDVIEHFQITPGPLVGHVLRCALRLYEAEQSDKDTLLSRIESDCEELLAHLRDRGPEAPADE